MKFWSQREFRREYGVRPPDKKSIRGLCEQFREKLQCGKQSFPGRDNNKMKMWVMFGRLFILSPKNSISRASAEVETDPSHGGASGCIAPITKLAASTRNLQSIIDGNSDQPAKGHCWKQRKSG